MQTRPRQLRQLVPSLGLGLLPSVHLPQGVWWATLTQRPESQQSAVGPYSMLIHRHCTEDQLLGCTGGLRIVQLRGSSLGV